MRIRPCLCTSRTDVCIANVPFDLVFSGQPERLDAWAENKDKFEADQYGNQTMAWGQASQGGGQGQWTVSGIVQLDTIHVVYGNGTSRNIAYRQINGPGLPVIRWQYAVS